MIEMIRHRPYRCACFSMPLNTEEAMAYSDNMTSVTSTMEDKKNQCVFKYRSYVCLTIINTIIIN